MEKPKFEGGQFKYEDQPGIKKEEQLGSPEKLAADLGLDKDASIEDLKTKQSVLQNEYNELVTKSIGRSEMLAEMRQKGESQEKIDQVKEKQAEENKRKYELSEKIDRLNDLIRSKKAA